MLQAKVVKRMRVILKLKAKEPLSIGFESIGTTTLLYKLPVVKDNGDVLDIPIIPGNSIRGAFRDVMVIQFLQDVKEKLESNQNNSSNTKKGKAEDIDRTLTVNAGTLMTLFSGGILAKSGEHGLNAKKISEKMENYVKPLLPLSIMGCALVKFMVPSKLKFGIGYPIVEETKDLIDDLIEDEPKVKLEDILITVQMMRKDDKVKMSQLDQLGIQTNFEELDKMMGLAEEEGDNQKKTKESAVQQRFVREAVAPGTTFVTYIEELIPLTEAEWGLVFKTLENFSSVGGSICRGFGKIKVEIKNLKDVQRYKEAYKKFIEENIDYIINALKASPEIGEKSKSKKGKDQNLSAFT